MNRCNLGLYVADDIQPPERCRMISKDEISSCKECGYYNNEYDLIEHAIESAKCRIYRLSQNRGNTKSHQIKAKNQEELMKITIKALEFYRDSDNW